VSLDSGKPVVLYNPHVSPHLSSWYAMGGQVLDWFAGQDDYQLIFAPHVMLFERPLAISIDRLRIDRPGRIAERHRLAPNIHVDLGSRQSTTMAYLNRAEIYLGDVSSQVYEFLVRPRPCVFLNAHRVAWRDDPNFAHWHLGDVVDDPAQLMSAIRDMPSRHHLYLERQQRAARETFGEDGGSPSRRAADAILEFLGVA
jgi:CDP-glycerol glycerophosphotransferase (TagB/SpsB family)